MKLQAHPSPKSPRGYDDDFLREKTGTDNYYARKHPVTEKPYHAAIDLPPSRPRVDGDPIHAPWDGTIRLRSFGPAYGRQVTVVADDGYGAFMAHLSAIYVSEGQRVKAGQHIADMGNTGSQSVGTHGHFEKRKKWDDWNSVENPYQELRALEAQPPIPEPPGGGTIMHWEVLGGKSKDVACEWSKDRFHVVVANAKGEIYHKMNQSGWSEWKRLDGKATGGVSLAAHPTLNRVDLVVGGGGRWKRSPSRLLVRRSVGGVDP